MKTFMNAMAGVVAGGLLTINIFSLVCLVGGMEETMKLFNDKLDRIDSRTQQTKRFVENLERVEETEG